MRRLLSKTANLGHAVLGNVCLVVIVLLVAGSPVAANGVNSAGGLTIVQNSVANLLNKASEFRRAARSSCHSGSGGSREVALSAFRNFFQAAVSVDTVASPFLKQSEKPLLVVIPVQTTHDVREFISVLAKKGVRPETSTPEVIHKKSDAGIVLLIAEAFRLSVEEQDKSYCGVLDLAVAAVQERGQSLQQMLKKIEADNSMDADISKKLVNVLALGLENTRVIFARDGDAQSIAVFEGLVPRAPQVVFNERIRALSLLNSELELEDQLPPGRFWMKNLAGQYWRVLEASNGMGGRVYGADRKINVNLKHVRRTLGDLRDLIAVDMADAVGVGRIEGFGRRG